MQNSWRMALAATTLWLAAATPAELARRPREAEDPRPVGRRPEAAVDLGRRQGELLVEAQEHRRGAYGSRRGTSFLASSAIIRKLLLR